MNPAQAHLALNHLPVVGAALVTLLLIWGLSRRSRDVVKASLGLTVLIAIMSYVAVATGERAEEYVEEAAWFDEDVVETHEELGELAFRVMIATGLLGLFGLWQLRGDRELKKLWPSITLAALVVSTGLMGWAAAKGGEIRHEEIRAGAASPELGSLPAGAIAEDDAEEDTE